MTFKKIALTIPGVWIYSGIILLINRYVYRGIIFTFALGFALPTFSMIVNYGLIIYAIRKSSQILAGDNDQMAARKRQREHSVTLQLNDIIDYFSHMLDPILLCVSLL